MNQALLLADDNREQTQHGASYSMGEPSYYQNAVSRFTSSGDEIPRHSSRQVHHATSLPNTVGQRNKSQSIPISNSIRRTASEHELSREEAEADYKDFLFYSRVVHGITSKQQHYQDGYLKYENELSLSNIMKTRNEAMYETTAQSRYDDFFATYGYSSHETMLHVDPAETDDDTGIFDLDL